MVESVVWEQAYPGVATFLVPFPDFWNADALFFLI